jgi:TatD DNase family protein
MMLVDSHCHLNFDTLKADLPNIKQRMAAAKVGHAMVIGVTADKLPEIIAMAEADAALFATVGIHPDRQDTTDLSVAELVSLSQHPKVVGIGETGLDYFHCEGDMTWQHDRFRRHIRAANQTGLPLIIHTRDAGDDTLRILQEEAASPALGGAGGVIHCFTESAAFAESILAMGFYLSFSGIVTFKNAANLQAIAKTVPLDRLLIETDAPYLAPVPHRGKTNEPSFVAHTAEFLANLRGISLETLAQATTANYFRLFSKAQGLA